jgi:hypothetical protein
VRRERVHKYAMLSLSGDIGAAPRLVGQHASGWRETSPATHDARPATITGGSRSACGWSHPSSLDEEVADPLYAFNSTRDKWPVKASLSISCDWLGG